MIINELGRVYEIVWAVLAISGGMFLLFFMDLFINGNIKLCEYLYKKTEFPLFKYYASKMGDDNVRLPAYIMGVIFIGVGIKILVTGSLI